MPARRATTGKSAKTVTPKAPKAVVTRFRMPSRRDAVARAVDHILELVEPARLSDDERDSLAVALAEALSNAAVHGNKLRAGASVRVGVAVTPNECCAVEVADSGPGFDQGHVSDPTTPDHLLATGGRGVFLMKRLVDGLEYNAAGNKVRLVMEHRRGR